MNKRTENKSENKNKLLFVIFLSSKYVTIIEQLVKFIFGAFSNQSADLYQLSFLKTLEFGETGYSASENVVSLSFVNYISKLFL